MLKKTLSDNQKAVIYFTLMALFGFCLFVMGVLLFNPFKELAIALNSNPTPPIEVWVVSAGLAFVVGTFWLVLFVCFETAKKGLLDLIFKQCQ